MKGLIISFATLFSLNVWSMQMTYEVPVSEDLKPFAQFDVQGTIEINQAGNRVLKYSLPSELIGTQYGPFTFEEKKVINGTVLYQGQMGKAKCQDQFDIVSCHVEYKNLDVDLFEVENIIQQRFSNPDEALARLEVAKLFSGEPVGVLTIK